MPTVEQGIQSQLRNIEKEYGRSIDEPVAVVAQSGLTKHNEVVAMLKERYGMRHGAAHRVSLVSRDRMVPTSQVSAPRFRQTCKRYTSDCWKRSTPLAATSNMRRRGDT